LDVETADGTTRFIAFHVTLSSAFTGTICR
jgi:hypothetical protein